MASLQGRSRAPTPDNPICPPDILVAARRIRRMRDNECWHEHERLKRQLARWADLGSPRYEAAFQEMIKEAGQ